MSAAPSSPRRTIVVSGMIAADPRQGGATWAVLQYLLGFRALGHEVVFVEPLRTPALRPEHGRLRDSDNASYFRQVVAEFGFEGSAALLLAGTEDTVGLPYRALVEMCGRADVLINISGMLADDRLTAGIPIRAYLDLDPAFNQFWAMDGIDMRFAGHTHFVTVGLAIGEPDCPVPTCGLSWVPTLQPIVLSCWPVSHRMKYEALTTVGHWRSYGSITYRGVFYGQKAHTLRQFMTLPRRTSERLAMAIAIHPGETSDIAALAQNGWHLLDPSQVTPDPSSYRTFIQESKAELGFAKSGYILSRCGWFSDRSLCYLASGRPVLATETGFSRFLPTGDGVLPFSTEDGLLAQIDALNRDYPRHARAARAIAEEHFDSGKVLTRLLQQVGAG